MNGFLRGFKKSERVLAIIEDALLMLLLFATMFIACAQIILRNGGLAWAREHISWATGLSWADPALKMLVLYLTIMGAIVATRENKHLSIDVLSKFLPQHINQLIQRLTHAFAALICGFMAYYSLELLALSKKFGDIAFNGIPTWILQLILPIGFALMALRFVFNVFSTDISADADFGVPGETH